MDLDHQKRIVHLEFQSSYCKDMAMRLLLYGLCQAVEPIFDDEFKECYQLPDSYIINVRQTRFSGKDVRSLVLKIGGQEVIIHYPIVDVDSSIPELISFTTVISDKERRDAYSNLCNIFGGNTLNAEWNDRFEYICALLCTPDIYDMSEISEEVVEEAIRVFEYVHMKTNKELVEEGRQEGHQEGRQEGLEEGLQMVIERIMKLHSWDVNQAYEFLGLNPPGSVEGNKGSISPMDLTGK